MNKTKRHEKRIINFFKIIFSFAFMGFILYYFFGKNSDSLQRDLLKVEYQYVILSMIFGGWAYVSRGLRWTILIDALGHKTSKINSVSAVSIEYSAEDIISAISLIQNIFGSILFALEV